MSHFVPGPPIRLSVLARLSGYGRQKLYADIDRGELMAHRVRCGQLLYWYVEREEADRYLNAIQERLAS